MPLNILRALFVLAVLSPLSLQADDAPTDARLRQALRDTTSQLRDAQSQLAAAQAAQAQGDKANASLQARLDAATAQLKTLSDQAAADKTASDQALADLRQANAALTLHLVDTLTTQINHLGQPADKNILALHQAIDGLKDQYPGQAQALDQYGADIASWVNGYDAYVLLQNSTEAQRAKLAAQNATLQRLVADREAKNLALYQLSGEILTRYQKFGLGDALLAREPFIGVSRVKLQTLVQDYHDKLRDQLVLPGQPLPPPPAVASTANPAALPPR